MIIFFWNNNYIFLITKLNLINVINLNRKNYNLKNLTLSNYLVREWMILSSYQVIGVNSLRKFQAPLSTLSYRRFHLSSYHCSVFESSSRFSISRLYSGYLRILRVASSLLKILVDREGSHWSTGSLSVHSRSMAHPIQWEWGNVGVTYKLLGEFGYYLSSFSTETQPISVPLLL